MTACFRKIWWGLLLATVTVSLCDHVVSHGLGYILMALGAGGLVALSPRFGRASALSWAALAWNLASVWLFDLLRTADPMTGEDPILYPAVGALVEGLLVWTLLGGIGEYATRHGRPELASRASRRRIAYVVLAVGTVPLQIARAESWGQLVVPSVLCAVAWIVWLVMALHLVHRVRCELAAGDDRMREDRNRPWQFSLRTLLLAPVALWLLLLACFPKLATGDFCDIRIEKLSVREDGQVELSYSTRTSSGTSRLDEYLPGGGGGSSEGTSFPAWSRHGHSTSSVAFNQGGTPLTRQEIRDRLLVEQGKTYRVTPEKPLYFYDFKSADGTRYCGCVKVTRGDRLGL